MIIVEGPDNSGKTTLINQLSKPLGIPVVQGMGKPHTVQASQQWVYAALSMAQHCPRVIFDRFPLISERIYGPVIRKVDTFGFAHSAYDGMQSFAHSAYGMLAMLQPLVIYCRPSKETILKTWAERDQMPGVIENLDAILDGYDRFVKDLPKMGVEDVYIYNFATDYPGQLVNIITRYLSKTRFGKTW